MYRDRSGCYVQRLVLLLAVALTGACAPPPAGSPQVGERQETTPGSPSRALHTIMVDEPPPARNRQPEQSIESMDAPDPHTVRVRWKGPYIYANAYNLQPLPRHIVNGLVERGPEGFTNAPYWNREWIGLGPQMDLIYATNCHWVERILGLKRLERLPSEYLREHAYWGFFDDPVGIEVRHRVGVDHILWGSDFPHEVSRWPHSLEVMEEQLAGVPKSEQDLMMRENAVAFFHLAD